MIYPVSILSSKGSELTSLAETMGRLAAEANSINSAISGCYGAGGVGGRAGAAASNMLSQANKVSHLGAVAYGASSRYLSAEDGICTTVYKISGETYSPRSPYGDHIPQGGGITMPTSGNSSSSSSAGNALVRGFGNIKSVVSEFGKAYKYEYEKHGLLYDIVEYGKCATRIVKAGVKIVGAVGAFSTGVGIPVAICSIISAGNDIINAANDAAYVYTDQYDEVGQHNILKDTMVKGYGDLGEVLGNREAGETAGELLYTGLDLVSFLDGADKTLKAFGKVNTDLCGPKNSFVWGEASWDDVFDNEYDGLSKLSLEKFIKDDILNIHPDSTVGLISKALDGAYNTYDKGTSTAEKYVDILTD